MYKNKKILIIGMARSGVAAAKLANKLGATVTVTEKKNIEEIKETEELRNLGVNVCQQSDEIFADDFDLVIKNPGINGKLPFITQFKERNIPVITEIEFAYSVMKKQNIIAVTGSNGKTTSCTLLYEIVKAAHPANTVLCGNIGKALCDTVLENDLLNNDGYNIILEISNFQLVDIINFKPDFATILNLSADHLDFHKDEDEYFSSKCRIYENMKKDDNFFLNIDDATLLNYIEKYTIKANVSTFSTEKTADIYADSDNIYASGEHLMPIKDIKIVGRHNVQNILACISVAIKMGIDKNIIVDVVKNFGGVEHRIEFVRELDGVKYYNDSKATNIDAVITSIKAFDKPIILLVGGFEKNLSFEPMLPYYKKLKKVICFGACGKRLFDEFTNGGGILVNTLDEALNEARKIAVDGDVILLSPTTSSYDQYSCFEERGEHFKKLVNGYGQ
jgi:UDP-N-acetylmuramoylalanine--D-glutamate ligase